MKITVRTILLGFFATIFLQTLHSQDRISYGYDSAGNRISRIIVISGLRAAEENQEEALKVYSEVLQNLEIRIYPNPTEGMLYIEMSGLPEDKGVQFSLYNLSGKLLINKNSSLGNETFDLTGQPQGTYILRIIAGENKSEWKIIKK